MIEHTADKADEKCTLSNQRATRDARVNGEEDRRRKCRKWKRNPKRQNPKR